MNEEIINNEAMDTIEETIVEVLPTKAASSHTGLKVIGGTTLILAGGYVGYKYLVKPLIAKIKAKRAQKDIHEVEDDGCVPSDD